MCSERYRAAGRLLFAEQPRSLRKLLGRAHLVAGDGLLGFTDRESEPALFFRLCPNRKRGGSQVLGPACRHGDGRALKL